MLIFLWIGLKSKDINFHIILENINILEIITHKCYVVDYNTFCSDNILIIAS
jgi:hypothetical protein